MQYTVKGDITEISMCYFYYYYYHIIINYFKVQIQSDQNTLAELIPYIYSFRTSFCQADLS